MNPKYIFNELTKELLEIIYVKSAFQEYVQDKLNVIMLSNKQYNLNKVDLNTLLLNFLKYRNL